MTYAELNKIKTSGFTTNCVIDDVLNNGRWAFGRKHWKKMFETETVSQHDMEFIARWAKKEGAVFPYKSREVA